MAQGTREEQELMVSGEQVRKWKKSNQLCQMPMMSHIRRFENWPPDLAVCVQAGAKSMSGVCTGENGVKNVPATLFVPTILALFGTYKKSDFFFPDKIKYNWTLTPFNLINSVNKKLFNKTAYPSPVGCFA